MAFMKAYNRYMHTKEKGIVDILKLFFSVCVVAIHTNVYDFLPSKTGYILKRAVGRLAVPFFFLISAFFLKQKINKTGDAKKAIKDYCVRLLYPYIIFETISVIINVFIEIKQGYLLKDVATSILKHLIFYPFGGLWFVWASIIAAIILYFFIKHKKLNYAILLGLLFYVFMLLFNNYHFVAVKLKFDWLYKSLCDIIICPRNALTVALPYMSIGMKCYDLKDNVCSLKRKIFFLFVLYLLYLLEIYAIYLFGYAIEDEGYYILQLPITILLVQISTYIEVGDNIIYKKMREISTGVFFIHSPLNTILSVFIESGLVRFVLVIATSVVLIILFRGSYKRLLGKLLLRQT